MSSSEAQKAQVRDFWNRNVNQFNQLQRDDVGTEANNHLRGRLSADAAADVWLAWEVLVEVFAPSVGDRVAHEYHAVLVRSRGRDMFCPLR